MFDHTTLVAADDPELPTFQQLASRGLAELRVLEAVGCESIARHTFNHASRLLVVTSGLRVALEEVEVREHSGNSASYRPATPGRQPGHVLQPVSQ